MTSMTTRRRWLLAITLGAGVFAALWKYGGEPATAALLQSEAAAGNRKRPPLTALPEIELGQAKRREIG